MTEVKTQFNRAYRNRKNAKNLNRRMEQKTELNENGWCTSQTTVLVDKQVFIVNS